MEVKTITYQRVHNLGNYESERFEMTAELDEFESPTEAAENLKELVEDALGINPPKSAANYDEKPF